MRMRTSCFSFLVIAVILFPFVELQNVGNPFDFVNRGIVQNLVTPLEFLENFLNVTRQQLEEAVHYFSFQEVKNEDIQFIYFKEGSPHKILYLHSNESEILDSNSTTLKFLVHGWGGTGTEDWIREAAKNYHDIGIRNIFGVDWSKHSKKNYIHAASSTKNIGKIITNFILKMTEDQPEFLKDIHIIGHSLGAHVAGFAGKTFNESVGHLLYRITALDAAAPLFETPIKMDEKSRLSAKDAEFVDAYHSNAGFLGFSEAFAKADLYINNGGPIQPQCFNLLNIPESFACSHGLSIEMFVKSIKDNDLKGSKCVDPLRDIINRCLFPNRRAKVLLGEHGSKENKGIFYVDTEQQNNEIDNTDSKENNNFNIGREFNPIAQLTRLFNLNNFFS